MSHDHKYWSCFHKVTFTLLAGWVALSGMSTPAYAEPAVDVPPASPAMKRAGYSLPWLMRPAIAPDLLRLDSAIAFRDGGSTQAPTLTGGLRPIGSLPTLGFYGRVAVVHDSQDNQPSGTIVSNPLLFALFTPEIASSLRLPVFFGVTAPVGGGGGNTPELSSRRASLAGIYGRQAMDNALFATNYMTTTAGVGLAWVHDGWTVQGEVTLLELIRARGSNIDKDKNRTNFTSGVHLGYQVIPWVTLSLETHYQRWLSTPAPVQKDASARDALTLGGGLRFNVPVSPSVLMRPGMAYFHPLDDPMSKGKYKIMQVDLPVTF
ncbi:MAG: hypothetical protein U0165_16255 [Polyangiaceae bacterium]